MDRFIIVIFHIRPRQNLRVNKKNRLMTTFKCQPAFRNTGNWETRRSPAPIIRHRQLHLPPYLTLLRLFEAAFSKANEQYRIRFRETATFAHKAASIYQSWRHNSARKTTGKFNFVDDNETPKVSSYVGQETGRSAELAQSCFSSNLGFATVRFFNMVSCEAFGSVCVS